MTASGLDDPTQNNGKGGVPGRADPEGPAETVLNDDPPADDSPAGQLPRLRKLALLSFLLLAVLAVLAAVLWPPRPLEGPHRAASEPVSSAEGGAGSLLGRPLPLKPPPAKAGPGPATAAAGPAPAATGEGDGAAEKTVPPENRTGAGETVPPPAESTVTAAPERTAVPPLAASGEPVRHQPPAPEKSAVVESPPVTATGGGTEKPADGAGMGAGRIIYEEHFLDDGVPTVLHQPALPDTPPQPSRHGGAFSLIIDDLGYNPRVSLAISRLPADITLAVLPGGSHSKRVARLAVETGKELILHQPMEPRGYPKVNPGPGAMLSSMGSARIQRVLRDNLALFPNAVGINNHMGSRLTANRRAMDAVMIVLLEKSLYFIDSRTSDATVALARAKAHGVPAARREIFLDNVQNQKAIHTRLTRLERLARRRSGVIGIGHPYPETLAALKQWLPGLSERGGRLVRASQVLLPYSARSRYPTGPAVKENRTIRRPSTASRRPPEPDHRSTATGGEAGMSLKFNRRDRFVPLGGVER